MLYGKVIVLVLLISSTKSFTPFSKKNDIHVDKIPFAVPLLSTAIVTMIALPVNALDPQTYNGEYRDPFHPLCERRIEVSSDGKSFHYSGTDVGPKGWEEKHGCSKKEIEKYGLRRGTFDGKILDDGRLSVGDGVHEAMWEPANTATTSFGFEDVDGVRFDDHNKWVRYDQSRVAVENKQYVVKSKTTAFRAAIDNE